MPKYQNSYFDCTVAVSRHGIKTLLSKVPDFDGWAIDGDFPEDDGWKDLLDTCGLYRCRIRVTFWGDNPEFQCEKCYPTHSIILQSEVVLNSSRH